MSLKVMTHVSFPDVTRARSAATKTSQASADRISSGDRIDSAADDAAGLGISEASSDLRTEAGTAEPSKRRSPEDVEIGARGRSELRTLRQDQRDLMGDISRIQTATAGLDGASDVLHRMRDSAALAAGGGEDLRAIQTEIEGLRSEVDRIAQANGLGGDQVPLKIDVQLGDRRIDSPAAMEPMKLASTTGAQKALDALDAALTTVNAYRSTFGAIQNRLESTVRNLQNFTETTATGRRRLPDADSAFQAATEAKYQILRQSGIAVLGQANVGDQAALRLLG